MGNRRGFFLTSGCSIQLPKVISSGFLKLVNFNEILQLEQIGCEIHDSARPSHFFKLFRTITVTIGRQFLYISKKYHSNFNKVRFFLISAPYRNESNNAISLSTDSCHQYCWAKQVNDMHRTKNFAVFRFFSIFLFGRVIFRNASQAWRCLTLSEKNNNEKKNKMKIKWKKS